MGSNQYKAEFEVYDISQWEEFVYNLALIAPGKGEAKKTVSRGFIRLEMCETRKMGGYTFSYLSGMATDDLMSIYGELSVVPLEPRFQPLWTTVEALRALQGTPTGVAGVQRFSLENHPEYDENFDRLFWVEHTYDSICGEIQYHKIDEVQISPDRLRKFSLLKPTGNPITWEFGEWADRDIIRWTYEDYSGVYVPLG